MTKTYTISQDTLDTLIETLNFYQSQGFYDILKASPGKSWQDSQQDLLNRGFEYFMEMYSGDEYWIENGGRALQALLKLESEIGS